MSYFIRNILDSFSQDCFTDTELNFIIKGTDASRYNQVKRAIAKNELISIRKGLYALAKSYQRKGLHPYTLAQKIYGPSYLSMESALSFYAYIPEAVYSFSNVCSKRSKSFETPLGNFYYTHIPLPAFGVGIQRKMIHGEVFLIASPLKALTDYVYKNRLDWVGLGPVMKSLRIEKENLRFSLEDISELSELYASKRIFNFLEGIRRDLRL